MCQLYEILKPESKYYDRKNYDSQPEYNFAISTSTTVYVGNLSFYVSQDSVRELFSQVGRVKEVIMGINNQGNPCGFCFVIYETHEEAGFAVEYISKTKLCDRIIRVDWDPGYKKDREKGRGSNGQQRRDDFRSKDDAQRPRNRSIQGQSNRDGDRSKYEGRRDNRYERRAGDRGGDRRREDREDRHYERRGHRSRDN